jgi:hypothetical protein
MKFKSLFALVLTLATIGLSLPAVAGDRDNHNNRRNNNGHQDRDNHHNNGHNNRHNYYGKYHYYKLGGSHIFIGEHGDYFDSKGEYHEASEHRDYAGYYKSDYDYKHNSYYEHGKYYAHN